MNHLKSYKLFESVDKIKSIIEDILKDNVLDKYIPLKIHVRNYNNIAGDKYYEVIKVQIGDDDYIPRIVKRDFLIRVDELKEDIITITSYLDDEGFEYNTFSYIDDDGDICGDEGDVMQTIGLETTYLSLFYKREIKDPYLETIKVPIEVGDTVLGGRFKNKKIVVKKIGKNKKGDITINDKPLLKFRIVKENLQEDIDYYLRHLEDDNFLFEVSDYFFRIFKPINGTEYSYTNCKPFQWSEIAGEIDRYVSELEGKSIDYCYVMEQAKPVDTRFALHLNRKQIPPHRLSDQTFDCGEILSFTIGFK
jgi:hypothetical protein